MSECRDVEPLLTPFVDDEAAPAERATVDAHLRSCPRCREYVTSERTVRQAFVVCRASLHVNASADLRRRCEAQPAATSASTVFTRLLPRPSSGQAWRSWVPLSMAATLVLAVAGVFVYGLSSGPQALAAQLAADHVKCFDFAPTPTILPEAKVLGREWAAARGWALKVPETAPVEGLELLAVRRCISADGTTAHLMYRWRGQPLSVYVMKSHPPRIGTSPTIVDRLGQEAIIWSKGERTYAVVTRGRPDGIERVAQYVRAAAE